MMYKTRGTVVIVIFAYCCSGQEQEKLSYDVTEMMQHLLNRFEGKQMIHFPSKLRQFAKRTRWEEPVTGGGANGGM